MTESMTKPAASRWGTYLMERSPPAALLTLCLGVAGVPAVWLGWNPFHFAVGVVLTFCLLFQMRLGDEIKDYSKDVVIHPERPLPRGLLSVSEAKSGLLAVMILVLLSAMALGASGREAGGALLALSTIYIWMMYKEFFIGRALSREPMTYALTHQLIVFPLYGWVAALSGWSVLSEPRFVGWLIGNFGASFAFEIARKLDPNAPKLAGTYLHHYGPWPTAGFIALCVGISAFGVNLAGLGTQLFPIEVAVFLSLALVPLKPSKFKAVEGLSVLSALLHLWMPIFLALWNLWRSR